jgi:hypothetical protein
MKRDLTILRATLPRRGWLGAVAAGGAAWIGTRIGLPTDTRRTPAASSPPAPRAAGSSRTSLMVRPAPDSVKRHG